MTLDDWVNRLETTQTMTLSDRNLRELAVFLRWAEKMEQTLRSAIASPHVSNGWKEQCRAALDYN